jgi:hypothetical protein
LSRNDDFKKRRDILKRLGIHGTTCNKCNKKKLFSDLQDTTDTCRDCNVDCDTGEIIPVHPFTIGFEEDQGNVGSSLDFQDQGGIGSSSDFLRPDPVCIENYCDKIVNGDKCKLCDDCKVIHEKHRKVISEYWCNWNGIGDKGDTCKCKECKHNAETRMCKNIFCKSIDVEGGKASCNGCIEMTLLNQKTRERQIIKTFDIPGRTCTGCKEKVEFVNLVNDRDKCVNCKNSKERTKSKQANSANKASTKKRTCDTCNMSKELVGYDGNRKTCNSCRNKTSTTSFAEKIASMTKFKCSKCKETFPIDQVGSDRFECKGCLLDRRHNLVEDRKTDPNYFASIDRSVKRTCNNCKYTKELSEFYFRPDTYLYSYLCFPCKKDIMGESYKKMMFSRYVENPKEERRKNAERMKEYREKNPKKWKEIMDKWKSNPVNVMNVKINLINNECRYTYEMSHDRALELITRECYYCDGFSDNVNNFNGYDRVNNEIHYTDDNVVACCSTCNYIKHCLSQDIFLQHAKNIVYYFDGEKDKIEYIDFGYKSASYNKYKDRAENDKEISFLIDEDDFNFIKSHECYLCGFTGTTGIDRINNELGYSIDNCASCCAACNYMKKDYEYDFFIEHLRRITSVLGTKEIIPLGHKVFICLNESKLDKSEATEVREQRNSKKRENTLNKYKEYLVKN